MRSFMKRQDGFSLVELMIVVGIIGVLTMMALPRFKQFQAKAKMGEARSMLAHIHTLQQSYSIENNTFVNFGLLGRDAGGGLKCTPDAGAEEIGFQIDPCDEDSAGKAPIPRYGYVTESADRGSFKAVAKTGEDLNNFVCPKNKSHSFEMTERNRLVMIPKSLGAACPK